MAEKGVMRFKMLGTLYHTEYTKTVNTSTANRVIRPILYEPLACVLKTGALEISHISHHYAYFKLGH